MGSGLRPRHRRYGRSPIKIPAKTAGLALPRFCVSAVGGGCGKTIVSLGLGRAFANAGLLIKPFKKGPDYIDAAWLARACGCETTNLDPFFMSGGQLRALFARSMNLDAGEAPIALIEGNRGLYDGLDEWGSCSTAALARALKCPLIICVDCAKTTRTVAAILYGLMRFERYLDFRGVILNRVGSPRHETALRRAIENHTRLPILGALPRFAKNPVPERHMGLASHGGSLAAGADETLNRLAGEIRAHCDLDSILKIALQAPRLKVESPQAVQVISRKSAPRIGFVLDDAFWFYYPENLAALREAGAETVPISCLAGNESELNGLSGLYIGGGFPEDYAPMLSQSPLLNKIKALARRGLPIYAECGGLVLLCAGLKRKDGFWPMCGLFDAIVELLPRPVGLGYVLGNIIRQNPFFPVGMRLRGHEFHYSRCVWPESPPSDFALQLSRGTGSWACGAQTYDGFTSHNVWGGYTHIFAPAVAQWAPNFVRAAASYRSGALTGGIAAPQA